MNRSPSISNNKKRKVKPLLEQAAKALTTGRLRRFESLCEQINQLWPNNPDVINMHGIHAVNQGRNSDAESLFVQAVNLDGRRVEFRNNLGRLYLKQKVFDAAADVFGQAMRLNGGSLAAQLGFASALVNLGYYEQAGGILEAAKKKHPDNSEVYINLYQLYRDSKADFDVLMGVIEELLKVNPEHIEGLCIKGRLHMEKGDVEVAEAAYRRALSHDSDHIGANQGLSRVINKFSDKDLQRIDSLYNSTAPGSPDRVYMGFVMGDVLDRLKQYDRAFEYYKEANDLRHFHSNYEIDSELAHLQEIMRFFTPEICANTSSIDCAAPIFIVGMPRCGSTLTEQIIASHPDVVSRGECNDFIEHAIGQYHTEEGELTLERITAFSDSEWSDIGGMYLNHIRKAEPGAVCITDKSLNNIRFVGALHCALPNARIIHVRRNPLDTCLSIYKSHFRGGVFGFQFNLGEIAYYYRMYQMLMQHWHDVLPEGVMYELDYERLVENQEEETRKLLEYCGLEWDEACLSFNKAKSVVRTTSVMQVRRPIYRDSMAAWKRYEKHIQPLIKILGAP